MRLSRTLLPLGLLAALSGAVRAQSIDLVEPFPNLSFSSPVELKDAGDGTDRLYVAQQGGVIRTFVNDRNTSTITTFLDISGRVTSGGETGLLGLAFDPDYATNGYFYVDYTTGNLRTRISRFTRSKENPLEADPNSELILLEVNQPFGNHNAGAIAFGPPEGPAGERYLYVTLGDGGSGNDPQNNGQRPETLLGSILRLDVGGDEGAPLDCALPGGAATVPPDNPFVDGAGGACDEIYAYGFRNPWRMTLDAPTGQFWIGDVGQFAWEEVDLLEAGGNFGWRPYEGTHCILGPCNPDGKIFPVWEYPHSNGNFSITGGFVYRGAGIPELQGQYVYGDLGGRIWALDTSGATPVNQEIGTVDPLCAGSYCLASWGRDEHGELYALLVTGAVRKLIRNPPVSNEEVPPASPGLTLEGANPFRDQTSLLLSAEGHARVAVYDALGREVAVLFEGTLLSPNARRLTFDASGLPAGVYHARLETGSRTQTLPLTVVR